MGNVVSLFNVSLSVQGRVTKTVLIHKPQFVKRKVSRSWGLSVFQPSALLGQTGSWQPLIQLYTFVTAHEKTRLKTQFTFLRNAHIKVKFLFYFLLKQNLSNDNKIKSVWDICSSVFWILFCCFPVAKTSFSQKWPIILIFSYWFWCPLSIFEVTREWQIYFPSLDNQLTDKLLFLFFIVGSHLH